MVAHVATVAFNGIDVVEVDVQVQVAAGLPAFAVVGLPDKAVGESRERVRGALGALGLALPAKRLIVNLAPASLVKKGSHFDLPIALGLLVDMGVLGADEIAGYVALGELGLDGSLAAVPGVLPAALAAAASGRGVICPRASGGEATWAGIEVVAAPDLRDIKGQETAKRALEVAAAGGHNLLMVGPPGAGKSMLAQRLPGLLPPLDAGETLEVSMIRSIAGLIRDGRLSRARPYRDPHHSASLAAMVGGGTRAKPGEVTLAHRGVLFLDELPEFQRPVLEALRQPLETASVTVARANAHVTYPAALQLVAAMNPCRCGHIADAARACSKAPRCALDYQSRISGPLLDRIDLHVEVRAVDPADLALPAAAEGTAEVAARVEAARAVQRDRYGATANALPGDPAALRRPRCNAEVDGERLAAVATPDAAGQGLLVKAAERLKLSARGYHRVLRLARTLADLEGTAAVRRVHIAEALSYRDARVGA